MLGAWCRSHARPYGSFKAPHLNPSHVPLLASVRVADMHYLDVSCTLFECCPWRCLCTACTLPYAACMPLCAPGALPFTACALPCALVHCLAFACALLMSNRRQPACRGAYASFPTAFLCPAVPLRLRWGAPMAWP